MNIEEWICECALILERESLARNMSGTRRALQYLVAYSEMSKPLRIELEWFEALNEGRKPFSKEAALASIARLKARAIAAGHNGKTASLGLF